MKRVVEENIKSRELEEMIWQTRIDNVTIPFFHGADFSIWKFRLLNILEYTECQEPAGRAVTPTDDKNAWKKKGLEAKTIVISALSDKQLEFISVCQTVSKIIYKLEKIYSTKSPSLQIINRGKLEENKLKNYSNVE